MSLNDRRQTVLAIHHHPESFSDRWIEYCRLNRINFQLVNLYASDVIGRICQCDALLWQPHHINSTDALIARHIIKAAEEIGMPVFPNSDTFCTFDDKIAQKYLLEAIGAPLITTHVFFDRDEALRWAESTTFPKVFKLRRGAGSRNVTLIESKEQARKIIGRAFGKGFRAMGGRARDTFLKLKSRSTRAKLDLFGKLRRFPKTWQRIRQSERYLGKDIGYVYFQEFVPHNQFDTRVTVVGDIAFAFRRAVRSGDFRASGSGVVDSSPNAIDLRCIDIALSISRRLRTQSLAFDFVQNGDGEPEIVEMSFAFLSKVVHDTNGYWDRDLVWHRGAVWPEDRMLENILSDIDVRRSNSCRPSVV